MAGRFRAFGRSMEPVIPHGSRVTIEPVGAERIELGDVVVVQVGESTMLHLVKAVDRVGGSVEISGTSGPANGWTTLDRIHAVCTEVGGAPLPGATAKTGPRRRRRAASE